MTSEKPKKKKGGKPATQMHVPIAEIRDGVVILKDGTLRAVLMVSSINFALKSEDEQNALISAYVGFLNSIDFPIQIVVQSRKLQIGPYLEKLGEIERAQTNELLKVQIADYRAFVTELIEIGQIMTKRYYVVVPYDPLTNKRKNFWSRIKEVSTPVLALKLKDEQFARRKEDLEVRIRHVMGGLESMGVSVALLDTQALIELYYATYNPDVAASQPLAGLDKIQVEQI